MKYDRCVKPIFRAGLTVALALAATLAVAATTTASAQETPRFSISPRLYATWISGGDQEEPLVMPLYGLTASAVLSPRWDIAATILYGEGSADSHDGSFTKEAERLDFELLGRYRIPESAAYMVAGFRNINVEDQRRFSDGSFDSASEVHFYMGEFGLGAATRVSKSGRHAAFGNLVLGFGRGAFTDLDASGNAREENSGNVAIVDANVGYQYAIERWIAISARYRLMAIGFWVGGKATQEFVHGPELAMTFRF